MNLPYFVIRHSSIPRITGKLFVGRPFLAQTIGPWIFIPGQSVQIRVWQHEVRHVSQFYIAWGLGIVLWVLTRPGWWWFLATPLAFTVAYVLAGFYAMLRGGHFYRGNPFEVDARRHAGEPE